MINLSITLMLIGIGWIVVGGLTYIVKELWEEWEAGFKKDVLFILALSIPIIFIGIGAILFLIFYF